MSNYTGIGEILDNTEYSVLHGWEKLPDKLDSDLDIVINPSHLNHLEKSLLKSKEGKLVQLLQHESSCYYFVLAHGNGNGLEYLKVDAATDYRRNGFTFFTADQFIRRRHKWNSFWVTSPSSEFPYLLVKKILKGETPDYQKKRFYDLVSDLGIKKSKRIAAGLFGKKLGYRVVSWIYANEWNQIDIQLPTLRRALIWHELKRNPINPLKYWFNELKRITLRWKYPTGLFVVILGPDGSGKTTLIESLREQLLGAFRTTDVFHLRPNILGRSKNNSPVTDPHGKPARTGPVSLIKLFYYLSDYTLGYLFKIHSKLIRSSFVIFDRYYDDILVDPKRYRFGSGQWFIKQCRKFVPKPDLYIILDVDENELIARKQEVSLSELKRQRAAYRKMSTKLKNAYVIDGSANEKQVLKDTSELILNFLHNRYIERRNVWFDEEPHNPLVWLNSVVSPDIKKTVFRISDSRKSGSNSEWGTYKKFRFIQLKDGRAYLFPHSKKLFSKALGLYNVQTRKAKLFKTLSKITGGSGLMKTVRLMVSRDQKNAGKSKIHFLEYLKEVTGRSDIDFSISLGTPGPDRKPVIQILSETGEAVSYVKIGTGHTNKLVRNEAETIEKIAGTSSESFSFPELIHKGMWQDNFFAIQSAPVEKTNPAPKKLGVLHIEVLTWLAGNNCSKIPLESSPYWKELNENVEEIKENNNLIYGIIKEALLIIEGKLGNSIVPFHLGHGDFAPWNTYLTGDKLYLFDWEYSSTQSLAGSDLFHFIIQTDLLLNKAEPTETYNKILDCINNDIEKSYWEKLEVDNEQVLPLFILHVLERTVKLVSNDDNKFNEISFFSNIITQFICSEGEGS